MPDALRTGAARSACTVLRRCRGGCRWLLPPSCETTTSHTPGKPGRTADAAHVPARPWCALLHPCAATTRVWLTGNDAPPGSPDAGQAKVIRLKARRRGLRRWGLARAGRL